MRPRVYANVSGRPANAEAVGEPRPRQSADRRFPSAVRRRDREPPAAEPRWELDLAMVFVWSTSTGVLPQPHSGIHAWTTKIRPRRKARYPYSRTFCPKPLNVGGPKTLGCTS